tara:strand:+ start:99 stop:323 length:225 start_codon:yes stop_codon:yes gene_type:complete
LVCIGQDFNKTIILDGPNFDPSYYPDIISNCFRRDACFFKVHANYSAFPSMDRILDLGIDQCSICCLAKVYDYQ